MPTSTIPSAQRPNGLVRESWSFGNRLRLAIDDHLEGTGKPRMSSMHDISQKRPLVSMFFIIARLITIPTDPPERPPGLSGELPAVADRPPVRCGVVSAVTDRPPSRVWAV